jgi:hypothetical protein
MENFRKLLSLCPSNRWLVLNAYFTIIGMNLLLKFVSYNRIRQSIANQSLRKKTYNQDPSCAIRIAEAVKLAGQYTPGKTTCLVKALSGYYLLTKHNIAVEMYIGVKLGLPGQLNAHAWIMNQGEVILGNLEDLPSYTKLTSHSVNAN